MIEMMMGALPLQDVYTLQKWKYDLDYPEVWECTCEFLTFISFLPGQDFGKPAFSDWLLTESLV